ncbi:Hypothetical predicted protein [Mytilus galloprovincialis]|uniref:Uncharacterized protein n=1 Tax=Mytilus galloprovincialis TaxID=29158 RepID=A0A8B6CZR1_MYTGA|nr:Hypothetical predicted protein [Mytilus galloprovincialis]
MDESSDIVTFGLAQNIEVVARQGKTPPKRKIRPFVSASRGRSPIRSTEPGDSRRHSRSLVRRRREELVPSIKSVTTRLVGPVSTSQTSNVSLDRDTRIVQSQSPRAVAANRSASNHKSKVRFQLVKLVR